MLNLQKSKTITQTNLSSELNGRPSRETTIPLPRQEIESEWNDLKGFFLVDMNAS